MSFGYSVGDFVLLVQLAHRTIRNCQKAGTEYVEIAHQVRCLRSVLRILRDDAERPESKIFQQDRTATAQLIAAADGCKNILDNLNYILDKYDALGGDGQPSVGKKIWQRFRFGSNIEELAAIRGKLIVYTSTISVLIDAMQLRATDRVETATIRVEEKVEVGFTDMKGEFEHIRKEIYTIAVQKRAEERRGSAMSSLSLSTYAGDEKAVWQDFRRVLIQKGFRSRTLETHREVLEAYMLRLDQSGLLDQNTAPASSPTNESPWWSKRMYMETVQSLSDLHLDGDTPSRAESLHIDVQQVLPKTKHTPEAVRRLPDGLVTPPHTAASIDVGNPIPMDGSRPDNVSSSNFDPFIGKTSSSSAYDSNSDDGDGELHLTRPQLIVPIIPKSNANHEAQESGSNKQHKKSPNTLTEGLLHGSFAENPRHSIKYSPDVIAQNDSMSVDSLAERVTNSDNDSDSQMSDLSDIDSQDSIQDDPAITMGAFGAPNEHSTISPHPIPMVMPLDTSLVDLKGPRLPRETLEEQHQDLELQSRGYQSLTEAEQSPIPSFSKYHVRCDYPSRQNLQIRISKIKTPCHRTLTPAKSILKQATKWFPDPAHYEMIAVAPRKARKDSKWEPVSRIYPTSLDPEALTAGKESIFYYRRGPPFYTEIIRALSEEDTESYKFFTELFTAARSEGRGSKEVVDILHQYSTSAFVFPNTPREIELERGGDISWPKSRNIVLQLGARNLELARKHARRLMHEGNPIRQVISGFMEASRLLQVAKQGRS